MFFRGSLTKGRRVRLCQGKWSLTFYYDVTLRFRCFLLLPKSLAFLTREDGWGYSLRFKSSLVFQTEFSPPSAHSNQRAETSTCRWWLVWGVAKWEAPRGRMRNWSGKNAGMLFMTQTTNLLQQCHELYKERAVWILPTGSHCFRIGLNMTWNENWPFPVLWPLLSFPNLLAYLVQHFHSIIF